MTILYDWVKDVQNAKKTAGYRWQRAVVHFEFIDGRELVDEYSQKTGLLTYRAWKIVENNKTTWCQEVGVLPGEPDTFVFHSIFENRFEWKIHCLHHRFREFQIETCANSIIVTTPNGEVVECLQTPALARAYLMPELERVEVSYNGSDNTLTVTYPKLQPVKDVERDVLKAIKKSTFMTDISAFLKRKR